MPRIIFLSLVFLFSSCAFFGDKDESDKTANWSAERIYAEARGYMDSGDFRRAVKLYEILETRFPFGVYGQQSLLDLAYVYYKTDDIDAAVSAADRFIKLYPQNAYVDYAFYLKGIANYNRGKGFTERVLPIDASQRDPSSAMQSFQDLSELVKRYPDSIYAEDAKQRMVHLRNLLAEHEIEVAKYYMRRSAFLAAANRARYVVEKYPRTPSIPDALVIMAKAYKIMEMEDLSNDTLRVLELNYPNHPGLYEVREIVVK